MIRMKNERELRAMLREAERELDAARGRSALNEAARKLMQAKAALKRLEQKAPTRPTSGAQVSAVSS